MRFVCYLLSIVHRLENSPQMPVMLERPADLQQSASVVVRQPRVPSIKDKTMQQ